MNSSMCCKPPDKVVNSLLVTLKTSRLSMATIEGALFPHRRNFEDFPLKHGRYRRRSLPPLPELWNSKLPKLE